VSKHLVRSLVTLGAAIALSAPLVPMVLGQFPAESTIPKAKRGNKSRVKKGMPGPTPRMADGKVNLMGVWGYANYTSDIAKDYEVGELPMTELSEKLFLERQDNLGKDDPEARCLPTGTPRRDPYPMKMVQTSDLVVILFEGNIHSFRQIFLDRGHPPAKELDPTFYGHSTGKWDGNDALTVDTIGFNGKIWLDMAGHAASEQLRVTERYTRPELGTLKWDITIDDPIMYKKPWNVTQIMPLIPKDDLDLIEYICTENNRDVERLVGK
jgi:hypothetical protein